MPYRIRLLDLVGPVQERQPGDATLPAWLASYDPDAYEGRGDVETTTTPARAMRFGDFLAAWNTWRQVSHRRPTRPDGEPNRPLAAFTIAIERIPEEHPS